MILRLICRQYFFEFLTIERSHLGNFQCRTGVFSRGSHDLIFDFSRKTRFSSPLWGKIIFFWRDGFLKFQNRSIRNIELRDFDFALGQVGSRKSEENF